MKILDSISQRVTRLTHTPIVVTSLTTFALLFLTGTAHAGTRIGEFANCYASWWDFFGALGNILGCFGLARWAWAIACSLWGGGGVWAVVAATLMFCVGWTICWRIYLAIRAYLRLRSC